MILHRTDRNVRSTSKAPNDKQVRADSRQTWCVKTGPCRVTFRLAKLPPAVTLLFFRLALVAEFAIGRSFIAHIYI